MNAQKAGTLQQHFAAVEQAQHAFNSFKMEPSFDTETPEEIEANNIRDTETRMRLKNSLTVAKRNLRTFIFKQKGHMNSHGVMVRV
jgi:hypothetical protein